MASLTDLFSSYADTFTNKVSNFIATYQQGFPEKLDSIWALLLTLAVLCVLECLLNGWQHSSVGQLAKMGNSQKTDLLSALLYNLGLLSLLGTLMSGGFFYFFIQFLRNHFQIVHPVLATAPPILALLAYYLTIDFFSYWVHRLFHRIPTLWILHRYHHSAREMTMLNTFRSHPLYDAIASLWMAVPLLFIPAPAGGSILIALAIRVHTLLLHSNISADWGWIGRWLIQSPAAHRVHHSRKQAHFDKNFGATLIIWDRMFGTLRLEPSSRARQLPIGVPNDPGSAPPLRYMLDIYREFVVALSAPIRRLFSKAA